MQPITANRLALVHSTGPLEVLFEYEAPLNRGLLDFEYPLFQATDEELEDFLGKLVRSAGRAASGVAKTAAGAARTVGKVVNTVQNVIPASVLTSTLSWTPVGMAVRAGLAGISAAGSGKNVFQAAARSLASTPLAKFAVDTGLGIARGENVLKSLQKAAQGTIGDARESLRFAAMVAALRAGRGHRGRSGARRSKRPRRRRAHHRRTHRRSTKRHSRRSCRADRFRYGCECCEREEHRTGSP
jgi:hypothetical protein